MYNNRFAPTDYTPPMFRPEQEPFRGGFCCTRVRIMAGGRLWEPSEVVLLAEMCGNSYIAEMAQRLNRSATSVKAKLYKLRKTDPEAYKRRSGTPHTTTSGYRRMWDSGTGRCVMEHRAVWECAHGSVPDGHCLHHINGDKQDNALNNLALVTFTEHKRIHNGCELRDGVWWKPCRKCGEEKVLSGYYKTVDGFPDSYCKACRIKMSGEMKRAKKREA